MEKRTRRRNLLIVGSIACVVVGIAVYYFFVRDPDAPRSDWPVLQGAENSKQQADVIVGPNVQISPTDDTVVYWECVIAADPTDRMRLFSAVILRPKTDIVGFYSRDGGATWHLGCHQTTPVGHSFFDPSVAFGPDGAAYLVYMDVDRDPSSAFDASSHGDVGSLVFLGSEDGGRSWEKRTTFPEFVDRPWLAVDGISNRETGNVYCLGQVEPRSAEGEKTHAEPILFRSSDGLRVLSDPVFPHVGRQMVNCRPANPVVFSDGTLFLAYQDRYLKRHINFPWPRPVIYTSRSSDGGRSFKESTPVNTKWWHDSIASSGNSPVGAEFPQLAVDAGSKHFLDRLYCVWSDGYGDDGTRIFFSSSTDRGERWSHAVVLSEQPMEDGADPEYLSFVPSIAVNNDGVVAVSWYDRRGLPKSRRAPLADANLPGAFNVVREGWNVRLRVSFDGGATWLPSVQVNDEPGRGDVFVGHTAGLAAAPDGRFHLAWIDNHTGKNELWTAAVKVHIGERTAISTEVVRP